MGLPSELNFPIPVHGILVGNSICVPFSLPISTLEAGKMKSFLSQLSLNLKVKVTQSCLTLCYPLDYTVHGILQARRLEWVAISFSRGSS